MLKAILYLSLTAFGIIGTVINPFAGVITCIEAYLMNPSALSAADGGFRYQLITSLTLLGAFLLHRPGVVEERGSERWIMRFMWAFVAIGALSALWAVESSTIAIVKVYEVFKTVLFVAIIVRLVQTERQMTIVVTALIIGAWHAAFMHVFGVRWGYASSSLGHEVGVLSDPQTGVMILFVPLLLVVAIFGARFQKILAWGALPFVLDSIVETYERTGLAAVALQVLLLLFYLPRRITVRIAPAIFVAGALFIFRLTPTNYWEKMGTILHPHEEASANSRFVVNSASLHMFFDFPWGVGYQNYAYVSPLYLPDQALTDVDGRRLRAAHNSFFAVLCDTGAEGFALWMAIFLGAIISLRRVRRGFADNTVSLLQAYAIALELGLYGWLLGGWTQDYQEVDPAYWFAGLAVVLTRLSRCVTDDRRDPDLQGFLFPAVLAETDTP